MRILTILIILCFLNTTYSCTYRKKKEVDDIFCEYTGTSPTLLLYGRYKGVSDFRHEVKVADSLWVNRLCDYVLEAEVKYFATTRDARDWLVNIEVDDDRPNTGWTYYCLTDCDCYLVTRNRYYQSDSITSFMNRTLDMGICE
jgi:hypothetical protein